MPDSALPPGTRVGTVHLRVAELDRQVQFYEDVLGFTLLAEDGATAALGAGDGRPLLVLHSSPGAPARPAGSTGLFHAAFLLPSRRELGALIQRVDNAGWRFDGFADHNVSEAAYLKDPEGNGLELYADRPRDVWHSVDGGIFMTTEPLDLEGLLLASPGPARALPKKTSVGHVHLRVSTLESAEAFYVRKLGFGIVTRGYPGALFVAAGGYHHHLGLNVWGGRGASPPPEGALGIVSFELLVPDGDARRRVLDGGDEGTLLDADNVAVRIARA